MKKIRLDLGRLNVQSFVISDEGERPRGTVHGEQATRGCGFTDYCEFTLDCVSQATDCGPTGYGVASCAGFASCDLAIFCNATHQHPDC